MKRRNELAHIIRHHCTSCALRVGQLERELREYFMASDREIMMEVAWRYLGTWYKWGGDDPEGFDCSGLVCECLQSVGLIGSHEDYTAQGLWNKFKAKCQVAIPEEGCLVFWEDHMGHVIHIEICINDRLAIGAKGGGSHVKSAGDAAKHNAYIKVRPMQARTGIKGYVDPFKSREV